MRLRTLGIPKEATPGDIENSILRWWDETNPKVSVPANATSLGQPGQWAADTSYLYIYTGDGSTHSWRRVGISSW